MTQVWFEGETDHLDIEVTMQVETLRHNVFDFILAPEAAVLPIAHEHDALCARAYLERIERDDAVTAFAAELSLAVNRDTLRFLDRPNRQLFAEVTQTHRDAGAPQGPVFYPAEPTRGMSRSGRVVRRLLAARFASGYQRGHQRSEQRHLHAWPEVYLPGAGWRGLDPTHGEAVADTHVTIAAAARSRDTLPVSGNFLGAGASSTLDYTVEIKVTED